MVWEMESAPGEMGSLGPLGPGSDAALLPVLLGTGFLLSCFPPERLSSWTSRLPVL